MVDGSSLDVAVTVMAVAAVGKMAGEHFSSLERENHLTLVDLLEARLAIPFGPPIGSAPMARPASVMVAGEQVFPSSQATEMSQAVLDVAKGDVAKHPDGVFRGHCLVPSSDETVVHCLDVAERTA